MFNDPLVVYGAENVEIESCLSKKNDFMTEFHYQIFP